MSRNNRWPNTLGTIFERKSGGPGKFLGRLRSGSLPGWIGTPTLPNQLRTTVGEGSAHAHQSRSSKDVAGIPIPEHKELNLPLDSKNDESSYPLMPIKEIKVTDLKVKDAKVKDVKVNHLKTNDIKINNLSSFDFTHDDSLASTPTHHPNKHYTIVPMKRGEDVLSAADISSSKERANEALGLVLSALYGKLLVVLGIAFPMAEVISTYIPPSFYDGFYLYLYFGSITFMICIYGNVVREKASRSVRFTIQRINTMRSRLTSTNSETARNATSNAAKEEKEDAGCEDSEGTTSSYESRLPGPSKGKRSTKCHQSDLEVTVESSGSGVQPLGGHQRVNFGSFYLRIGAIAFGIGSMIYSGLEFGQYFELDPDTKCHNFMIALTPAVRMIFTFGQMYFIFLNSKMAVSSVRLGAQFGLMHMIGTNMCVWLNVIIQETRHEILHFYDPDNHTFVVNYNRHVPSTEVNLADEGHGHHFTGGHDHMAAQGFQSTLNSSVHHRIRRGLRGPHSIYECRRTDIMGSLVQNASSFLFPCTIEYSLICAAILYVMWKSIAKRRAELRRSCQGSCAQSDSANHFIAKRSPHSYSVDCARANKGLFIGIFFLVMTIISLILFFVLISRPGYQGLATMEVNITELVLYTITTVAVLIGMCQVRELKFVETRNLELDNILLIVAQTGSFIYNVFTVIGGHFTLKENTALVMMTGLACLIQVVFQTLFILDATKRCAATSDQVRRKPGREIVTFLLVTNLAMWLINTLEKSRADSHPVQLKFYGLWAWTIITHISMPLAIFYRFHSTVCLCEVWKKAFKMKSSYR